MRLLHVSDLHGSVKAFQLAKELYFELGADLLVVSGDLTGKCVSNGKVTKCVWGRHKDPKALGREGFEASGGYFVDAPDKEVERNAPGLLARASAERVRSWVEELRDSGAEFYIIPGNVDHPYMDEALPEPGLTFKGLKFCPLSHVPYTPFGTYREASERRLEEMLPKERCDVLVSHTPPKGYLDYSNYHGGGHVGSEAVREWIARFQPLLGLHGHVHESPGAAKLGRTLLVNPGSEAEHGALLYALIDLDGEPRAALGERRF
ncbi:MAG: hypothetical protein GXO07_02330 [Crenarchaeota archaeon]|nr:hypothetical protein [Thermoproteota archaeon]